MFAAGCFSEGGLEHNSLRPHRLYVGRSRRCTGGATSVLPNDLGFGLREGLEYVGLFSLEGRWFADWFLVGGLALGLRK